MERQVLIRLGERLSQSAESLGRAGIVGVAMLVAAATFASTAVLPRSEELASQRERLARIEQRAMSSAPRAAARPVTIEASLERFAAHFPGRDAARAQLLSLHAIAAKHGLVLRGADYRVIADPASGLIRHQANVPVQGAYPGMRAFIADVIESTPTLVLETLSIKRASASARELDGLFVFSLYTSAQ